jgi:hypothetical protein
VRTESGAGIAGGSVTASPNGEVPRTRVRTAAWSRAVYWSQLPSRRIAHMAGAGLLACDVQHDPAWAGVLRGIIGDGGR